MPLPCNRSVGRTSGRVGRLGHHGGRHGRYITESVNSDATRNTTRTDRRSQAPLTARSVLASALLGEEPPELPVAQLVHLAGLFGINENRARVALSRMVAAGEATTDGSGRYRLAGHLLARQVAAGGQPRRGRPGPGRSVADGGGDHDGAARPTIRAARRRGLAYWPGWPSSARGCGCDRPTSTCVPTPATTRTWPLYSVHARRRSGRRWPPRCGISTGGRRAPRC